MRPERPPPLDGSARDAEASLTPRETAAVWVVPNSPGALRSGAWALLSLVIFPPEARTVITEDKKNVQGKRARERTRNRIIDSWSIIMLTN